MSVREVQHPTLGTFKLGRRAPVARQPMLKLGNYVLKSLPTPPDSISYAPKAMPSLHKVYLNDQLGDCVIAGGCHLRGVTSGNAGNVALFSDQQVIQMYSAIGGYVPGNPNTDNGANEQDAFNYWIQHGFPDGVKLAGFLSVDATNIQECKTALYLFENCFTADTKVSLLDGRELSFEQLINEEAGKDFWVYSCTPEGKIVPGHAHSVQKTGIQVPIIEITLDNGENIRCTEQHKFMMRDGSYRQASKLSAGDSLMPLYRQRTNVGGVNREQVRNLEKRERFIKRKNGKQYTQIMQNGRWMYTHRMVAENIFEEIPAGYVVHHRDENPDNNTPENLNLMQHCEHSAMHISAGRNNVDPDLLRENCRKLGKKGLGVKKPNGFGEKVSKGRRTRLATDPRLLESLQKHANQASLIAAEKYHKSGPSPAQIAYYQRCRVPSNHKVISVRSVGREDVYDMTVDKYHNFALTAGVFVHNCFFGISLPDAWLESQMPQGDGFTWDLAGNPNPRNGHAVMSCSYDANTCGLATWGMYGNLTWRAVQSYASRQGGGELYTLLSPDMIIKATQRAPNGFDFSQLAADFDALGGHVPVPAPPSPPDPPPVPGPNPSPNPSPGGLTIQQIIQWLEWFVKTPMGQGLEKYIIKLIQYLININPKTTDECEAAVVSFKQQEGIV